MGARQSRERLNRTTVPPVTDSSPPSPPAHPGPLAAASADVRSPAAVQLRVDLLTREYPPHVYGGAGVHVEYLARELRPLADVRVHCFGGPGMPPHDEPGVVRYADPPPGLEGVNAALRTMGVDLQMAAGCAGTDVVHSHTWYANLAGHAAKLLHGVPHVVTVHSLEPLRPWKAEQLGGGYALSSWCERTAVEAADAVIAVSAGMKRDVVMAYPSVAADRVQVVHNGIDTKQYAPDPRTDVVERLGIDPNRPNVVYVGRITRQKGLPYLLRAAQSIPPDAQLVLLAGAPDTPEIAVEVESLVAELYKTREGVIWIAEMLPKHEVIQVLTHATLFVCPSVYEPMGIVNLEAMACETAVVATATGGIPEVVADGSTGLLVPIEQATDGTGTPLNPDRFVADLAAAITESLENPERAAEMGRAGRRRAIEHFSWDAIAERTMEVYRSVLK
jgi:alpha-maltose-1-phosphate synthase